MKKFPFILLICAFVLFVSNACKKEKPNGSLHINFSSTSGHVFIKSHIHVQVWDEYHQLAGSVVSEDEAPEKDNIYSLAPGKYQLEYDVNYYNSSSLTSTGFMAKTVDIEIQSEQEYLVNDTY